MLNSFSRQSKRPIKFETGNKLETFFPPNNVFFLTSSKTTQKNKGQFILRVVLPPPETTLRLRYIKNNFTFRR